MKCSCIGDDNIHDPKFIKRTIMFLALGKQDSIPDGKRVIRLINGLLRRKSLSEEKKEQIRELRDNIKSLIKRLENE